MRFADLSAFTIPGTDKGMQETFGSTCHGAGRARSRNNSRNALSYTEVLDALKTKGIAIRCEPAVTERSPPSHLGSGQCQICPLRSHPHL